MAIRVLIVDDDPLARALFAQILRPPIVQVVGEAGDGAQALALYQQLRPDVVLLDLAMPGTDGFAAQSLIMACDPNASIVVCSAVASEWACADVVSRGARAFVRRPFHVADLRTAVLRAAGRAPLLEPAAPRLAPALAFA